MLSFDWISLAAFLAIGLIWLIFYLAGLWLGLKIEKIKAPFKTLFRVSFINLIVAIALWGPMIYMRNQFILKSFSQNSITYFVIFVLYLFISFFIVKSLLKLNWLKTWFPWLISGLMGFLGLAVLFIALFFGFRQY